MSRKEQFINYSKELAIQIRNRPSLVEKVRMKQKEAEKDNFIGFAAVMKQSRKREEDLRRSRNSPESKSGSPVRGASTLERGSVP